MLRFLLAAAGIGLIVVGVMYWTEHLQAKGRGPERTSVADIVSPSATPFASSVGSGMMVKKEMVFEKEASDKPAAPREPEKHYRYPAFDRVSSESYLSREWNSYVRIDGIEVEPEMLAAANTTSTYRYVPVKGSQDQLYLLVNSYDKLPSSRFTVVGHFVRQSPSQLPEKLASLVDNKKKIFLLTNETADYRYYQDSAAKMWLLPGVGLLVAAIVWQGISMFLSRELQAKLDAAAEQVAAPCAICQETAQRVPIYLSTERRRIVGYQSVNVAKVEHKTSWVHISTCRQCYAKLKKLKVVSGIAAAIGIFCLMGTVFGIILTFAAPGDAKLVSMIVVGASVGIAVLTWLWMTWRFKRILGPQLFQEFKLTTWNPLASKFEYGIRHVPPSDARS